MQIENISCIYLKKLYNAASQLVFENEPQLILELMNQIQQVSFNEGYDFAIDTLIERKV